MSAPAKSRTLPPLGEVEFAALEHLWDAADADVTEVHAAVGRRRGITPNTVGSALERLFRKGLVSRQKVSHAFRYSACVGRDEFAARRFMDVARDLGALAESGLLSAFVDLVADVDDEALDRLEQLIAQKREQAGRK